MLQEHLHGVENLKALENQVFSHKAKVFLHVTEETDIKQ